MKTIFISILTLLFLSSGLKAEVVNGTFQTEKSEEGNKKGLCWIDGNVKKFNNNNKAFSVPHMGWNNIKEVNHCEIFKGLNEKARFYFLHSYYFQEKKQKHVVAYTNYHGKFCASFRKKNL